ncbi:unnamed protein product [Soboliphyme baturini]|uniref:Uncharacterized protein n=1 Tax=Soboliphyme baturini TaxID=241478 RepID=A0A183J7E3_9BILA|nr:unnamed protein product [Soboliphyme baturini]
MEKEAVASNYLQAEAQKVFSRLVERPTSCWQWKNKLTISNLPKLQAPASPLNGWSLWYAGGGFCQSSLNENNSIYAFPLLVPEFTRTTTICDDSPNCSHVLYADERRRYGRQSEL